MVRSMWLFKHKFHADETLSRYKARLVANDSSQQLGVDFDETFSPVVKPTTIRTVLSLVVSRQWTIHQLDRSLYGLKQAPRAWFQRFTGYATRAGFYHTLLQQIIGSLNNEFDMTDLGALNYFLGIFADRTPIESKLGPEGALVQDPTLYRSLARGLQYLTFTRPDLSYVVQQICLYMHDPREPHLVALKRILRYVKGILDLGLHLYASSTTSLVGYTDADWAGCPSTRETAWLRNLLRELHSHLSTTTLVYYMVTAGQVRVLHVPSHFQYADIFTKGMPSALFEEFRSSLSVRPPPALTAGPY
ncbi:ribonuclease H-like domain-containing protein [Tanacetum coccineum]